MSSIAQPRFRVIFDKLKEEKPKTPIERFVDELAKEDDPYRSLNDHMRIRMREDGFARKIMPPQLIKPEDLNA